MGGFFAAQMKFAGYDVIIIEGKAKSPVWLKIKDDKVSLEKADFLWGKGTRATTEEICRLTSPETYNLCGGYWSGWGKPCSSLWHVE